MGFVTDPTGPPGGSSRVRRGGGWYYEAYYCRSDNRYLGRPDERASATGFRLVKNLPPGTKAIPTPSSGEILCYRHYIDYATDVVCDKNTGLEWYVGPDKDTNLNDAKAWADPKLNTPDSISAGKLYIDFDFTPPYPAEHISFRSHLVNDYLTEVLSDNT